MSTNYKLLGINDDVTTCECCGKSDLKCTVVMTNGEGEVHYGRQCAARALRPMFPLSVAKIERAARQASYDAEVAARRATARPLAARLTANVL